MSEGRAPADGDWAAVNDLFHRALEQPADARLAFLDAQCAGRPWLRAEVASLLAAHARASEFIESPAAPTHDLAAQVLSPGTALVGQTLGHYQIDRVLGEGGMGVVYLAQDTRLGRPVALKAVAPRFTGDESRRERLRREARAAAALTHPGIATVYALEEFDQHLYIASEYVAGETLRDEVRRGPLSPRRAIDTALDIARALQAAHDRGIVHRDLKPENVVRAPTGQVKILDFGLARFRDPALAPNLTDDGAILGTPAYMAPEQIRGQPADFRADLFAFGILFHEIAAGVHPFAAPDPTSTIAKILEAEPTRLTSTQANDSASGFALHAIEPIIRRCLAKDASGRFDATGDLVQLLEAVRAELDGITSRRSGAIAPTLGPDPGPRWWWQFHQAAVTACYAALLYPLLVVLGGSDTWQFALLAAGTASVLSACTLRLHLWFSLRLYPQEWPDQQRRSQPWIRLADLAFVGVQLITAAVGFSGHRGIALLLTASGVATFLASTVIEPSTTRAAFKG